MDSILLEIKILSFKIIKLLILAPMWGYGFLLIIENFYKAWKSKNRKKLWLAITYAVIGLQIMIGWLL